MLEAAMPAQVTQLRDRAGETEKITINLGYVDLGHVDLLVRQGYYSNRTDVIRTAIRKLVDSHQDVVKQTVTRDRLDLGLRHYGKAELEAAKAAAERLRIQVLGLVSIGDDVSIELAKETIESIKILGALHARPELKAALSDRIG
jgi:Arc/MetJ-type ribon-helix-helix transcriptional regulator